MLRRVMAVTVGAVALVGCGSSGSSSPSPSSSSTSASSSVSSPLSGLALTAAQVTAADPGQPATAEPAGGATALSGPQGVTLDACGTTYPSEALRTQRLQLNYMTDGHVSASNEVVRYQSAAAATQAFSELTAAIANCKPWTMSNMTQVPADAALVSQQVIISGDVPSNLAGHPAISACFAYQFHGDLLSAVYVYRLTHQDAERAAEAMAATIAATLKSAS